MNKIGIFYGSSGGNTRNVAKIIAEKLSIPASDIHDVGNAKATDLSAYNILLFGTSTWGIGDLQDDWQDFIGKVEASDLSGKKIALFGCGDSSSFSDSFCDGVGKIYQSVKDRATVIGFTETSGYSFDSSEAVISKNQFAGLLIDEDNESNLTESRIDKWIESLKQNF
jgi:flavodoxin I